MNNLLMKAFQSRWFPNITKPMATGAVTSGILIAARALHLENVLPTDANALASVVVGFLAAGIVQKPGDIPVGTLQLHTTVATHTATYKPGTTLGETIAQNFVASIANEIDADPSLLQSVAAKAFERVFHPAAVVEQKVEEPAPAVEHEAEPAMPELPREPRPDPLAPTPAREVVNTGNAVVVAQP